VPMRTWTPCAVAVLIVAGLAGCTSGEDDEKPPLPSRPFIDGDLAAAAPFTVFLCRNGYATADRLVGPVDRCNHRVTLPLQDRGRFDWTGQHGPANEVSVAVDPLDPLHAIGGAKDYSVSYLSDVADCGEYTVWMGAFATFDGGLTWTNDLVPGFPGDPRDSPLRGNTCNTDPVMAFDDDGTAWFHALNYDGGREDSPVPIVNPLGTHDLYTGSQLYFAKSPDGGRTYPGDQITFASFGDDQAVFNDKNWFALQPGGDHMIATWSNFIADPLLGLVGGPVIMFTESQDGGATWSVPQQVPGGTAANTLSVQFSMPQYLPGGDTVAVIWADFAQSGVRGGTGLSETAQVAYTEGAVTPGGTAFQPARQVFPMDPLKSGSGRDGTGPTAFRLSTYPVLAVDTSGGEHDGRRHVVWADQPGPLDSDVQVLLRWSDDGIAWSDPVTVNDVEAGDQFMPWVDVDPDGGVHVAWYDRRNDPDNRLMDVYYAYSADGGATFGPNVQVTEVPFDGDLGHHQNGGPFIGDYIGLDAASEAAYVFWADTRHAGEPGRERGSDVYSATILRDAGSRDVFDAVFAS